jgi:hypothetical protein
MTTTTLVGHWLHILDGEYATCGQITLAVGPSHFLVRLRPHNATPPISRMMKIDDLCDQEDNNYLVAIFDSEMAMDKWLKCMDSDDGGKVVAIRKETT